MRNTPAKVLTSIRIQLLLVILVLTALVGSGCYRERPSDKAPIHLNPSMDHQPKYRAQSSSNYFEDGSAMRTPVEGTVARGELREDVVYYAGKDSGGKFVKLSPVKITPEILARGQQRYEIFCTPCHGAVGDGRGIVGTRGMVPPPSYHNDLYRNYPDGQLFDVITNGVKNMASYKAQINVSDRWAIVSYLRALQRSQNASLNDVPVEIREQLNQSNSNRETDNE